MSGRPKPTALKILNGNPGHRRLNLNEPKPTGTPTQPDHLDRRAKLEWNRITAELSTLGLLAAIDRSALAAYCSSYSRWVKAEISIAQFGLVIKAPKTGHPVPNPYVAISNVALDLMRKFCMEFGLTPRSRAYLHVEPDNSADPFETFMRNVGAAEAIPATDMTDHDSQE